MAVSVHVGLGSAGFSAIHEERRIGVSITGMTVGGGSWGLLSWVKLSGRTSSFSSSKFVGTWVEFCRISSIVDGTTLVSGR